VFRYNNYIDSQDFDRARRISDKLDRLHKKMTA
jgi:hypothetical protein